MFDLNSVLYLEVVRAITGEKTLLQEKKEVLEGKSPVGVQRMNERVGPGRASAPTSDGVALLECGAELRLFLANAVAKESLIDGTDSFSDISTSIDSESPTVHLTDDPVTNAPLKWSRRAIT